MPRYVPAAAYETLGVSPSDDLATIRQSWRRQVREIYPQVLRGENIEAATRKLAALNDAFDDMRWHHSQKPVAAPPETARQTRKRATPARPAAAPRARKTPARVPMLQHISAAASQEALRGFSDALAVFSARGPRTLGLS